MWQIGRFFLLGVCILALGDGAKAGDMCSAILKNGTFDSADSYSSSQNFSLIKNALCNHDISTYQDATSSSGNLGLSIIGVLDGTLGGTTNNQNFHERQVDFCQKGYSDINNNSIATRNVRTASKVISDAWQHCVDEMASQKECISFITVSKDFNSFTISITNNTGTAGIELSQISHPNGSILCDRNAQRASFDKPIKYDANSINIGCTKNQAQTVQISMSAAPCLLEPVDVSAKPIPTHIVLNFFKDLKVANGAEVDGPEPLTDADKAAQDWYGDGVLKHNAPFTERHPSSAVFMFTATAAGDYGLQIEYAAQYPDAAEPTRSFTRPVDILVNGHTFATNQLTDSTGGFDMAHQKWTYIGKVNLDEGYNELELRSSTIFPHIHGIKFDPAG
jgi:hypothetical protein